MNLRAPCIALGLAMIGPPAFACTICHTPTALGVRHLLLDHDLARNAAAIVSPLPVLLAVILAVAGWPRRPTETRRGW